MKNIHLNSPTSLKNINIEYINSTLSTSYILHLITSKTLESFIIKLFKVKKKTEVKGKELIYVRLLAICSMFY